MTQPKLAEVKPLATKVEESDRHRVQMALLNNRLAAAELRAAQAEMQAIQLKAPSLQADWVALMAEMGAKYGGDFISADGIVVETGEIQRGAAKK